MEEEARSDFPDNRFSCAQCYRQFSTQNKLKKHKIDKHGRPPKSVEGDETGKIKIKLP